MYCVGGKKNREFPWALTGQLEFCPMLLLELFLLVSLQMQLPFLADQYQSGVWSMESVNWFLPFFQVCSVTIPPVPPPLNLPDAEVLTEERNLNQ